MSTHKWFILNNPLDQDQIKRLYKYHSNPRPYYLYENTLLEEGKEQGPYVVRVDDSPKFIQSYLDDANLWQGMMLETKVDKEQLLSHLKNMLVVRFEQEQKGLLNYFHPQVATYFFQMPDYLLPFWLGPIDKITWYGATWQDKYNGQQKLYQINNTNPTNDYILGEPNLSEEQLALLKQCEQDLATYRLSQSQELDYSQVAHFQQEANSLGLDDEIAYRQYILLRQDNQNQPLPNKLTGVTTIDKLQNLRDYWQQQAGATA